MIRVEIRGQSNDGKPEKGSSMDNAAFIFADGIMSQHS